MRQRTIRSVVETSGVGLHTGRKVTLRLRPAAADAGVVFVRVDLPGSPRVPAHVRYIAQKPRRTALTRGEAEVETIEHLMAALVATGVGNIEVELDAIEVPGLDGSALPFVELVRSAGIVELDAPRPEVTLSAPISVEDGGASIVAVPSPGAFTVSYTLHYDNPHLPPQHFTFRLDEEAFIREIAPARTWVLEEEVKALREAGMGLGATYDNTLVLGASGVIGNRLRFPDEFVRHKVLDLVGDLGLVRGSIGAHVIAVKSGHRTNGLLATRIVGAIGAPIPQEGRFLPPKAPEPAARPSGVPLAGHPPVPASPGARDVVRIRDEEDEEDASDETRSGAVLDIREIMRILPHRYPFLLIDRVIEMDGERRAVGLKNVTYNEHFFQGHFPGQPVMPGVLQIEAMAQLAGALLLRRPGNQDKLAYLLSIENAKFRKTVVPGDQLIIETETIKVKSRTGQVYARALVDGKVVSEATISFMLVDAR